MFLLAQPEKRADWDIEAVLPRRNQPIRDIAATRYYTDDAGEVGLSLMLQKLLESRFRKNQPSRFEFVQDVEYTLRFIFEQIDGFETSFERRQHSKGDITHAAELEAAENHLSDLWPKIRPPQLLLCVPNQPMVRSLYQLGYARCADEMSTTCNTLKRLKNSGPTPKSERELL